MILEYIFCSVIESPQIANRSPFRKTKPTGRGAAGNAYRERAGFAGLKTKPPSAPTTGLDPTPKTIAKTTTPQRNPTDSRSVFIP